MLIDNDNFCDVLNEWSEELRKIEELASQCAVVPDQGQNERTVAAMNNLKVMLNSFNKQTRPFISSLSDKNMKCSCQLFSTVGFA